MNDFLLILARALLSALFLVSGYGKLGAAAGAAAYFEKLGAPTPLLMAYCVGAFEVVAALCVLLGFRARLVSVILALFCIFTAYLGHQGDMIAILKNCAIAGGFLALAAAGPGAYAADRSNRWI